VPACGTCGFAVEGAYGYCPACGADLSAASSREQRKTVTVLFCDVAGSTELGETMDPERVRALLARYYLAMRAIVERHGGSVEKFIGDAVMAVFGVPVAHEDDALRAVRAAIQMRDAMPDLGLRGRIGITTGEVVTGTVERLVTGDVVNVAARLEQAARPGEILIGEPTLTLVREAVDVEPIERLSLKGKAEPVAAYPLVGVHEAPEQRHGARFVGREAELAFIREAWRRLSVERRCELVTILGEAGVGKSRLIREALQPLGARVVRGRCLPYGEGITYWPVAEVLRQIDVRPDDQVAASVIRSVLGESEQATSAEEIAWAFRKTLESAAVGGPLVVVFDDIHWGEDTFHDLIEDVAVRSSGAGILLLCVARHELSDRRPEWPVSLRLDPLGPDEVDELIPEHIAADTRDRIGRAAGGNPLFIGEIVAMAGETDSQLVVPPTLHALLAARVDQLDVDERTVLECGAIEGETFHRGAIQALAPGGFEVAPPLAALMRKELIRPDQSQVAGELGYRFRHLLIRDAAYEALAKSQRAQLHVRFADWLEAHGSDLGGLDEIAGYHLEQACRYRVELGLEDSEYRELALRAGRMLAAAGRRAYARGDDGAARSLLARATHLLPVGHDELPSLLALLGSSLYEVGELSAGLETLQRAEAAAAAAGQRSVELRARMDQLAFARGAGEGATAGLSEAQTAIAELERLDDPVSLARAWRAIIEIGFLRSNFGLIGEASSRLLECARRAEIRREEVWAVRGLAAALTYGPAPVAEAIPRVEEALAAFPHDPAGEDHLALLYAYAGRREDADAAMERSRRVRRELGQELDTAALALDSTWIAILGGQPERAEPELKAAAELLDRAGERGFLASVTAMLADVLFRLGRDEEAEEWTQRSEQSAMPEDVEAQAMWRMARAKVLARRGQAEAAMRLSDEGLEWMRHSGNVQLKGDGLSDRGEVLCLLGRSEEARPVLEEALAVYDQKGIVPAIERTRSMLAEISRVQADLTTQLPEAAE